MTISYDSALEQPLTTDVEIERRVDLLIGPASTRQAWFLFLDAEKVQRPFVMPVGGLPHRPYASPAGLASLVAGVLESEQADTVVVVLERIGPDRATAADREWASAIHTACLAKGVPVRAMLLSHPLGVAPLPLEDYRFA